MDRHELVHWHRCFKCGALVGCVCFVHWFIEIECDECKQRREDDEKYASR